MASSSSSPPPKQDPNEDSSPRPTTTDGTTTDPQKQFTLKTSDGELFVVGEDIAVQSVTIKNMIDDDCATSTIPLPNVDSRCMVKIIEYCKKHATAAADDSSLSHSFSSYSYRASYNNIYGFADEATEEDEMKKCDRSFADIDDQSLLFDLILAANFLNIKGLLEILCEKVASMMRGKTPEQIRETFHIVNDYTPEEEAEVRRENSWAFEN